MKLNIGITDRDWFECLSAADADEVNFWTPGEKGTFKVLQPGELFLFKLHSPLNFIVGGGHFLRYSRLPAALAWQVFREKNGVKSEAELYSRISKYRHEQIGPGASIGCIVLAEAFFFKRDQWIPAPIDWPSSVQTGKSYDVASPVGSSMYSQVVERLSQGKPEMLAVSEGFRRYGEDYVTRARLGQAGFRVIVTEEYDRRCAITGERTLPVLEAVHIRPYAKEGPHAIQNGLLLRADMHILFDQGLLTVTPENRVEVSARIQEEYTNGKLYYSYHGEKLKSLPDRASHRPSAEFLRWHNENQYVT